MELIVAKPPFRQLKLLGEVLAEVCALVVWSVCCLPF